MTESYLCFAPQHNTKGRRDADEFKRQAKYFLQHHQQDPSMLHVINNKMTKAKMRQEVLDIIAENEGIIGVFFFCHGYRTGIQFGFDVKTVDALAVAIREATVCRDVAVCFYSCDVARDADRNRQDDLADVMGGDGGFCDEMRDALCRAGAIYCHVDGHTTTGHTTRNPFVRRFRGDGSTTGGVGGFYIVPRTNKKLWPKWRKALRTTFRFDYPVLTVQEIHAYLNRH